MNHTDTREKTKVIIVRATLLSILLTALALASFQAAAQEDIVIDSGTQETVITRLTAAPAQQQLVCSDPVTGALGPCAGPDETQIRIVLSRTRDCTPQTCNDSLSTNKYFPPDGYDLIVDYISVRESFRNLGGYAYVDMTGVGELINLHVLGELVPLSGSSVYAGNVGIFVPNGISVTANFEQQLTGITSLNVLVSGRLVPEENSVFVTCNPDCD